MQLIIHYFQTLSLPFLVTNTHYLKYVKKQKERIPCVCVDRIFFLFFLLLLRERKTLLKKRQNTVLRLSSCPLSTERRNNFAFFMLRDCCFLLAINLEIIPTSPTFFLLGVVGSKALLSLCCVSCFFSPLACLFS